MHLKKNNILSKLFLGWRLLVLLPAFFLCTDLIAQDEENFYEDEHSSYEEEQGEVKQIPEIVFIRAYGSQGEVSPPVIYLDDYQNTTPLLANEFVTIEFDVKSETYPSFFAEFVHCSMTWEEDFELNEIEYFRTTLIEWTTPTATSPVYTHRGYMDIPNSQVYLPYGGNWKVKIYNDSEEKEFLGEARLFVVHKKANSNIAIYKDFYSPDYNISPSALSFEVQVFGGNKLFENKLKTIVLYRNNRWNEPFYVSEEDEFIALNNEKYRYRFKYMVGGFIKAGKKFRIEQIPAENGYRILDMSSTSYFPRITTPIRLPMSDWRRTGSTRDFGDEGAMITENIREADDDYLLIEFMINTDLWRAEHGLYIAGSFNNWNPDQSWKMEWDEKYEMYRLQQWVRRARHSYLYCTGRYSKFYGKINKIAFDEFEGNTIQSGHTFIALIYYKEFSMGGYDSIIGISAENIFETINR
jgi:Type 9 secretion system plug protein 1st domain